MAEAGEQKVDLGLEKLKPLMHEGEVFVTNAPDNKGLKGESRETGKQLAARLAGYADRGGKWQAVRVVDQAFDVEGKPVKGMVALVGIPKKQG